MNFILRDLSRPSIHIFFNAYSNYEAQGGKKELKDFVFSGLLNMICTMNYPKGMAPNTISSISLFAFLRSRVKYTFQDIPYLKEQLNLRVQLDYNIRDDEKGFKRCS